ncbi:hypothetical protein [Desulfosudis oleivorans]|uniref:Uncharacterized protein n=1 Tax=Desulfosudis oleivorans (strain DSM 6200 / JCM 39069 / Hxd3) TaxID=96561 RepID=A8ZS50_DESOH|nr:hypothetical protein [Desulfosudis oleivorans]ABW66068.1 hypothetical protein Dole_0258 [Desulfosudis oleivorans Hxd3]
MTDTIMEYKIQADPEQLQPWPALKKKLSTSAPEIPGGGFRQSRRVQGMIDCHSLARGYSQLFIYIQKGLGAYAVEISKMIKTIYSIKDSDIRLRLYLAAFGDPELTVHPRPYTTYGYKTATRTIVENLAGEGIKTPCLLDTLDMNPYLKAGQYRRADRGLIIIFASALEDVRFSETAMEKLSRQKNSYIVAVSGEEVKGALLRQPNFEQEG